MPKPLTILRYILFFLVAFCYIMTLVCLSFSESFSSLYSYFFISGSVFLLLLLLSFGIQHIPINKKKKPF